MLKDGASPEYESGTCAQYKAFTAPALRESAPDSTTSSRYSLTLRRPKANLQGSTKERLRLGLTSSIDASSMGWKNTSARDFERRAKSATNHFRSAWPRASVSQRMSSLIGATIRRTADLGNSKDSALLFPERA